MSCNFSNKFKTYFLGPAVYRGPKLKTLIRWCGKFDEEGLAPSYGTGSFGNLSVRLKKHGERFLITVSGMRLKRGLSAGGFFEVVRTDSQMQVFSSNLDFFHFAVLEIVFEFGDERV